jgi:hypothetical protein
MKNKLIFEDNNLGTAGQIPDDFFTRLETEHLPKWEKSREAMDIFMLRASVYHQQLKDKPEEILRHMASVFAKHNIEIAINDGGATWSHYLQGTNPIYEKSISMITRLRGCGFNIKYIALQSVLSKPVKEHHVPPNEIESYTMEMRISDVVAYNKQVRRVFPDLKIGIIDALPTKNMDYIEPYKDLKYALEKIGCSLDFIILDFPFMDAILKKNGFSFEKIVDVQHYVKGLDIEFGIICTDYAGKASAAGFQYVVLQGLNAFMAAGGEADYLMFSAWYTFPKDSIPEDVKPYPIEDPTMFSVFMEVNNLNYKPNGD